MDNLEGFSSKTYCSDGLLLINKKVKTMKSKQEVISTKDGTGLGGTFCDIGGYNFYFLQIDIKTYKNMSE